jgi:hypothetical protein
MVAIEMALDVDLQEVGRILGRFAGRHSRNPDGQVRANQRNLSPPRVDVRQVVIQARGTAYFVIDALTV